MKKKLYGANDLYVSSKEKLKEIFDQTYEYDSFAKHVIRRVVVEGKENQDIEFRKFARMTEGSYSHELLLQSKYEPLIASLGHNPSLELQLVLGYLQTTKHVNMNLYHRFIGNVLRTSFDSPTHLHRLFQYFENKNDFFQNVLANENVSSADLAKLVHLMDKDNMFSSFKLDGQIALKIFHKVIPFMKVGN